MNRERERERNGEIRRKEKGEREIRSDKDREKV